MRTFRLAGGKLPWDPGALKPPGTEPPPGTVETYFAVFDTSDVEQGVALHFLLSGIVSIVGIYTSACQRSVNVNITDPSLRDSPHHFVAVFYKLPGPELQPGKNVGS